jgi:hypothetical protein
MTDSQDLRHRKILQKLRPHREADTTRFWSPQLVCADAVDSPPAKPDVMASLTGALLAAHLASLHIFTSQITQTRTAEATAFSPQISTQRFCYNNHIAAASGVQGKGAKSTPRANHKFRNPPGSRLLGRPNLHIYNEF